LKNAIEKTTKGQLMRDAHIGSSVERLREDGRYAQRMDVSESSYYDSDRKVRLRKLIDGRASY
jgi:hypothetical protein